MNLNFALKLIDSGFSLITVGDSKIPNIKWKQHQQTPPTKEEFKVYANKNTTKNIGIVTGYGDLECVDFDLKIIDDIKKRKTIFDEFISLANDNIENFEKKFVIYHTLNSGYHILYRTKKVERNQKLAKIKDQALFETRGEGGYIIMYDRSLNNKNYLDIDYVTDDDRDILIDICKCFNQSESEVIIPKKEKENNNEQKVTTWDDYNSKTSIFEIIRDDFTIVKEISDRYIIRRTGAKSLHSGYVYKNSMCMYIFSTGTIYPHEKLISPFFAYAIKNHNGDTKEAARDLYKQGFGSRYVPQKPETIEKVEIKINTDDLIFPISIFPDEIQKYIIECNRTLNASIDYMGCSMMWLLSVIIGNSIKIEVKKGWEESASIWISVVGKAGIGKSPSINNIISPLNKVNAREISNYAKNMQRYQEYLEMDKNEQKKSEKLTKPHKSQFIVDDITLEALVELHEESKNSIGVFKDELAGWIKDMNKYRAGSDLEFWLSSWSAKSVSLNRKTSKSSFIQHPFIPVLGGIQPTVLSSFYTEENKDNGFIDRILFSYPDLEVEYYNDNEIDQDVIEWYNELILSFHDSIKHKIIRYNKDMEIDPIIAQFSTPAKKEWIRIFNKITDIQRDDNEVEYCKSMLPKLKAYIPRFALLINTFDRFIADPIKLSKKSIISPESVLKAERLADYFIAMSKKIHVDTSEYMDTKKVLEFNKMGTTFEKFAELYRRNPDLNKKNVADSLGITRQQIYKYIKKLQKV